MKLPLGVELYLFSNEDNHKQFGLLMRNDSFAGAIQKCNRITPQLSIFQCDSQQKCQKWDSFVKESAPPGGFDAHYALLHMGMRNCSTLLSVIHSTSVLLQYLQWEIRFSGCLEWFGHITLSAQDSIKPTHLSTDSVDAPNSKQMQETHLEINCLPSASAVNISRHTHTRNLF